MDCPHVHQLVHQAIVIPLTQLRAMDLKYMKWLSKEEPKKEDDDDMDFDSSDAQYKLIALMMNEYINNKKADLKYFVEEYNLKEFFNKR